MPNDSKAARDRKIHELVHAPEHQGEFGEALLLSEIYEAGYSAAISESLAAHSAKLQRLVTAAQDIAGAAPAIEALRSKGFMHTARILEADIERLRAALADMKEVEKHENKNNF